MQRTQETREIEIDFRQLVDAVRRLLWLIVVLTMVGGIGGFLFSRLFITPEYESSVLFYVNNRLLMVGGTGVEVNYSDISAAKKLVSSYIVVLQSRETLEQVAEDIGGDVSCEALQGMISADAVNGTEIFRVVVRGPDRQQAQKIADSIAHVFPDRVSAIIEGTSCKTVERPLESTSPSYPSHVLNALIGAFIGFLGAFAWVVGREVLDITIRKETDIAWLCDYPVLAAVPDMTAHTKGAYYGYESKKKKPARADAPKEMLGAKMSFGAAEAQKLLRTKLQFSFAGEESCHVIGVTSAMAGEGKSLSVLNLAYTLSQIDKRVLVVDCDLRRPTVSGKLKIQRSPGLSDYLTGQCSMERIDRGCGPRLENRIRVVTAGRTPPNPVELLSSAGMVQLMETFQASYDYILLDLPPVGEVSDALSLNEAIDGYLMVVRQDYCNRHAFSHMVRQFSYMNCNVLGIVYNCAREGGVYTQKYYRRYRQADKKQHPEEDAEK